MVWFVLFFFFYFVPVAQRAQSDSAGGLQGEGPFPRLLPPGRSGAPGAGQPRRAERGRSCSPEGRAGERAGWNIAASSAGPRAAWESQESPFPIRMGVMSEQNRSARSEQKTTRCHSRLPDPRREVFGVFPQPEAVGGGHHLQMGCGSEPQKLRQALKGGRHPQPSPGAGRHLHPRRARGGAGRSGGRILSRARGRLRARPPRRERSRRDLSRPPAAGGAQSRPGPDRGCPAAVTWAGPAPGPP